MLRSLAATLAASRPQVAQGANPSASQFCHLAFAAVSRVFLIGILKC